MLKRPIAFAAFSIAFAFGLVSPVVPQNTNSTFVPDATASSTFEPFRKPADVLDNRDDTWWNAYGKDEYLELNVGGIATVNAVNLKWYDGDKRTATFHVDVSTDGLNWTRVLTDQNSQRTLNVQRYPFQSKSARYIRIINRGNSTGNDMIAIKEAAVESVPSGKTYYVDCVNGSDSESGTSVNSAWRTLTGNPTTRTSNPVRLNAGDSMLLKRGCSFVGPLNAKWTGTAIAPIAIGAYGSDPSLPKIDNQTRAGEVVRINGQYQIVEYLEVVATKPGFTNTGKCPQQPVGWRVGFGIYDDTLNGGPTNGGADNIVRYSKASGFTAGVHFGTGSKRSKALHNTLTFNNVMSQNTPSSVKYDDDSGAWGVLLNGDYNEVAYNKFEGNVACSEDYDVEGASIEVYKARNNLIHHNVSVRESTFTELGGGDGVRSENNKYAYNVYSAKDFTSPYITNSTIMASRQNRGGEFLVVRGPNSNWGANPGTEFYHNTGYWLNVGISCGSGCSADILQARNNIMVASQKPEKSMVWADAKFGESNNIFWRADGYSGPSLTSIANSQDVDPTSKKDDPKFVDAANANFRLQAGSPAIDTATSVDLSWANASEDVYSNPAPLGSARDIGPAEYAPVSP